jgi:hypothetical protein
LVLFIEEEDLVVIINSAIGTTALGMIKNLEKIGKLSHEEAEEMRNETLKRFSDDAEKALRIYQNLRFDPSKEFKHPW